MRAASRNWTQIVGAAAALFALVAGTVLTSTARVQAQDAAGGSVWAGVYTEEQAKRGEAVAAKMCTSCHGPDLTGGEAGPALVGLEFIGNWTNLTMADFFDRVHSTMPADSPGTLTEKQTSDVAAYVLKLNKYPAGATELSSDLGALKAIKIEGPR
ncbi:MAG TPA: cytochrome c [Vicinamibacterales bacterium]|jgi:mono/diheme cytochrome c family protein|nr:cytochrome c [Vicinamibacterales bacterium]